MCIRDSLSSPLVHLYLCHPALSVLLNTYMPGNFQFLHYFPIASWSLLDLLTVPSSRIQKALITVIKQAGFSVRTPLVDQPPNGD